MSNFDSNPELFLGQNIYVKDTENQDKTFSTVVNAPNTTFIEDEDDMKRLSVTESANFNGIVINNVAEGILDSDVANVSQIKSLIALEKTRAEAVELTINNNISTLNGLIIDINNKLSNSGRNSPNTLNSKIESEISRATLSEQTLSSNLSREALNLSNEVSRAVASDQTLTSALVAEVNRSTNAEQALTSSLNNEVTRLTGEITRATNSEGTLTSNLSNEVSRAIGAEGTLTSNLSTEVSRATGVENTLNSNLSHEVSRASGVETSLSTQIVELTERLDWLYKQLYKNGNMGKKNP